MIIVARAVGAKVEGDIKMAKDIKWQSLSGYAQDVYKQCYDCINLFQCSLDGVDFPSLDEDFVCCDYEPEVEDVT